MAGFASGGDLSVGKLAWIDLRGTVQFLDVPERVYGAIDRAPDGNRIAVHVADVKDYIWIWDVARQEGRRVVHNRSEGWPRWNSDGRRLTGIEVGSTQVLIHDVEPGGTVNGKIVGQVSTGDGWEPRWTAKGAPHLAFQSDFTDTRPIVTTTKINLLVNWFEEFNRPTAVK